jgi:hypothetical protein
VHAPLGDVALPRPRRGVQRVHAPLQTVVVADVVTQSSEIADLRRSVLPVRLQELLIARQRVAADTGLLVDEVGEHPLRRRDTGLPAVHHLVAGDDEADRRADDRGEKQDGQARDEREHLADPAAQGPGVLRAGGGH